MSDDYIVQTSDRRIRTARTGGDTRESNSAAGRKVKSTQKIKGHEAVTRKR